MTTGRASRMKDRWNAGRWNPTTLPAPKWPAPFESTEYVHESRSVICGNPTQSAARTPDQSTRLTVVLTPSTVLCIGPRTRSSSHESTYPMMSATKIAMRERNPRGATDSATTRTMTISAVH